MDTALYDMAVIGAGPAGSVCAYSALASSEQISVALIDRDIFPRDKACGDGIPYDAALLLKELNLGSIFDGRPAVQHVQTTCSPKFRYLDKLTENSELSYYFVEREIFDHHLFKAAIRQGADDYTGHKFIDAEFHEPAKLWNLVIKKRSGTSINIRCRTLVGADGAGSRVRRLAGLENNEDEHIALALRAYAQAEGLAENVIRIDWLESLIPCYGWLFPLANDKVNIGVGIGKRDFKHDDRRLESYLEEYVQYLSSENIVIKNLGNIMTHPLPLGSKPLPLVPKDRIALIGDAASMIDPFTGDGIHYGIWAGHKLGHIIGQCVNRRENIQSGLKSYAEAYFEQHGKTMELSESVRVWARFHKLFM